MSTILKALRRIEEGKAESLERPLREDVVLAPAPRRRIAPSVLVAVTAVAFAATLAVLMMLHDRDVSRARNATASSAPAHGAAVGAAAAPERQAPPEPLARAETAQAPEPVAASAPAPSVQTREPDVVMLNPDARGRSPISVVSERSAPSSPPAATKRVGAVPSPRVLRTSWQPRPEKRTAWVQAPGAAAAQSVHEGDRVGGFLVREIEPAAVVLSDGAHEIRRSVGSP